MKEPYIAPLAEVATASGHAEPTEPEEIPAGIPAEGKPVKAGKAPTTQTGHEAIIQLALQCLRRCTEDDMARAEAAYHDQMKQYNELLIRVDELMEEVRL